RNGGRQNLGLRRRDAEAAQLFDQGVAPARGRIRDEAIGDRALAQPCDSFGSARDDPIGIVEDSVHVEENGANLLHLSSMLDAGCVPGSRSNTARNAAGSCGRPGWLRSCSSRLSRMSAE